ncbi:MAG: hypothetical protein QOE23_1581 [Pseudonocardiales bacterium]|jgi:hypothetical protein|nr:hypothetical protein [Pseudonocardiales bacterium]
MIGTCVCSAGTGGQNVGQLSGRRRGPDTDLPAAVAVSGVQPHHRPEGISQ